MIVFIWTRNDETGLLDGEFRDGDIFLAYPDSFEPSLGNQDKKSWLVIKVPTPANYEKFAADIQKSDYKLGLDPAVNEIKNVRSFRVDWRTKFNAEERVIVADANQVLPDGSTAAGGSVANGVVSGLFTLQDFTRK